MTWPKKTPLAIVEWDDSLGSARWIDEGDIKTFSPMVVRTVGWLAHREKGHIVLTASETDNIDYGAHIVIPRGCIRKITLLKEPKEAERPKEKKEK